MRDNVTGLMWEVKTDDGGLRDKDWTYSWYNPDATTNGGSAGYADYGDNCFDSSALRHRRSMSPTSMPRACAGQAIGVCRRTMSCCPSSATIDAVRHRHGLFSNTQSCLVLVFVAVCQQFGRRVVRLFQLWLRPRSIRTTRSTFAWCAADSDFVLCRPCLGRR